MDLRIPVAEPTAEERAAVDALLGPPPPGPAGTVEPAPGGRVAYGGRAARQRRHLLLPALLAVQDAVGWVGSGVLGYICERLTVPPAEAYGVASFYALLATEPRPPVTIHACDDIACGAAGRDLCADLEDRLGSEGGDGQHAGWIRSPCLGACDRGPAALVQEAGAGMRSLAPAAVDERPEGPEVAGERWVPTIHQERSELRLLRRVGAVDPDSLDDYLGDGGGLALDRAVALGPEGVLEELDRSGLRGRGGAAFPIGRKWRGVAAALAPRFVIANGDESEPGTFKDRALMEGDPFAVVEALTIAGMVTGAERGYLYVRGEYPEAVATLRRSVAAWRESGRCGEATGFDLEVRSGAGAYICGEETALFRSVEGHRGEPAQKPPYPNEAGLFDRPTAVNNIETLVAVLEVLDRGGAAFSAIGTEGSSGPKVFSVSGDVGRPGVYEVAMGSPLGDLVELAGGVAGTGRMGAVLMGGAAGAFVGPDAVDMPLSFEGASAAGATLGSGAVTVFDDATDFGPIVRRIARFFRDESCGQCVPCRVGTVRQEESLIRLGRGTPLGGLDDELRLLADVDAVMTDASICGLGRTAAVAIRSAIRLELPGMIT